MPVMSQPPDPHPRRPKLEAPPGACDCHIHLFGPTEKYPFDANAAYHAEDALPETYIAWQKTLGLSRAVIIHPTALGRNNARTLDALALYPERFRAVAVPADDVGDAELDRMHELGVRGCRFTSVATYANAPALNKDLIARIAARGWHAQFLLEGQQLPEMHDDLMALPCDVVIDHMGRVPADLGTHHPAFRTLLRMLESGKVWVKLSGPMRFSKQDRMPYSDTLAFARRLVETNPERLVWGSDWPHINYNHGVMPNDGDLLDLMHDWVPDEATRNRILADNPAVLYDFPAP
jgi:predicted TIM-barrel fold metal-dependent hydrolase